VFVGRLSHIHFGDWNADGVTDLLAGNGDGEVRVFLGKKQETQTIFGKEMLLTTLHPVQKSRENKCRVCHKNSVEHNSNLKN